MGLVRQLRTGQVVWAEDAVDVRRPFPLALAGLAAMKGTRLEIVLTNGHVATPGATRQTRLAYSRAELDRIALRLDALRRAAVGEDDPASLRVAVGPAVGGDTALAEEMVELGLVDEAGYARLLAERTAARNDAERP